MQSLPYKNHLFKPNLHSYPSTDFTLFFLSIFHLLLLASYYSPFPLPICGTGFLHFLLITVAATAFLAAARPPPSRWVPVPNVEKDNHVQSLGEFAVQRYDEQNHAELKFLQVICAVVMDRGTEHYTYKLVVRVLDDYEACYYDVTVLQDLSAPGQPPVLNLASFVPNYYVPPSGFTSRGTRCSGLGCLCREKARRAQVLAGGGRTSAGPWDGALHVPFDREVLDHNAPKYFKVEVYHDVSAPGQPPVLSLGYLVPK